MITSIILGVVMVVFAAYMIRHYLFTFQALFGKPKSLTHLGITGKVQPQVTVLIPAHNEEAVISNLLQRLTQTSYSKDKLEIVVVDDRSTDKTYSIVKQFARFYPYIRAFKRGNGKGGKAYALNFGYQHTNGEIIVTFDADYYPQLDIIEKLVAPFVDPEVGAVQGRVTVANEDETFVSKIVTLERIGGYRVDQEARDELAVLPQYGGTVGALRRSFLEEAGGWDTEMLTEDTDLTFRCILLGYKVRYVNAAESYEEAVTTWRGYWNQRYRWAKGHMQVFLKHIRQLWRSKEFSTMQKLEFTMLLGIYFIPVLVLLGWLLGTIGYMMNEKLILPEYFGVLALFTFSSVGNFAPFFEIGSGLYMDRRSRLFWLLPVLSVAFIFNALLSAKACIDLIATGRRHQAWNHTRHKGYLNGANGNGNGNGNGRKNGNGRNNGNGHHQGNGNGHGVIMGLPRRNYGT